ncbi:phospholipase A2 inhibitor NAI-like [Lithobates pipiens]
MSLHWMKILEPRIMAMTLAGLLVLYALVPSGTPLSCESCTSKNSTQCNGSLQNCSSHYVCASAYRYNITGETAELSVIRTCAPQDACNVSGSVSAIGQNITIGISCCNESGCTPLIPQQGSETAKPNGVQCESCVSYDSDSCKTTNTLKCSGDETKCVNYPTITSSGSQNMTVLTRGCGTEGLCTTQSYYSSIQDGKTERGFTCLIYISSGGNDITGPTMLVVSVLLVPTVILKLLLFNNN